MVVAKNVPFRCFDVEDGITWVVFHFVGMWSFFQHKSVKRRKAFKNSCEVYFISSISYWICARGFSVFVSRCDLITATNIFWFQTRVAIAHSNMPISWQVEGARLTEEALEFQTTDSGKLTEISELFSATHPYWYWNVVYNFRFVHDRHSEYYLYLTLDEERIYLFSTV